MPSHSESRDLPYSCDEMFAVVADVEHYPEFLPWCERVAVTGRAKDGNTDVLTAVMTVNYHGVRESYTSEVRMDRAANTVTAKHIKGPFDHLDTGWRFERMPGGCRIHFHIDFAFKNWVLSALAGVAFDAAAKRMTNAFVKRAQKLHKQSKNVA